MTGVFLHIARAAAAAALALGLMAAPALAGVVANGKPKDADAVFIFGGRYHDSFFWNSFRPWDAPYEPEFVLGGGYQHFFWAYPSPINIGVEFGAALRFATTPSAEAWGGIVTRFNGLHIGPLNISPALTAGFSLISSPLPSATSRGYPGTADPTVLVYLGPEFDFSLGDNKDTELFWRVQHRSGMWSHFGNYGDAANATTIGMRWHF